ncbi:MAG: carboxypeptidase-like regulatory domain-containing protein [Rhodothermaceae bacterium]|nr:carboxypeptidase-like regulatory domain-containing protein [Rhodothermaceae bacterium]MYF63982.1 carboxypeptidase-like regulatory domain-containing protein [Rhodothermaceae bacterium]MYI85047.1 carboxypeptidase-like regulatory domain-containing protein [Rhodothermaceae bacterium]
MYKRSISKTSGLIMLLCLACSPEIKAQILRGRVVDASTNETLPNATVQIAGTYRGTITNREGVFEIAVDDLPVDLVVRYIGYRTDTLTAHTETPLEFRLQPVVMEMRQLVVTDEDPAVSIMREVIERKAVWQEKLSTFEAQAYSRYTFSNDSGIVAITESAATAWWDKDRGIREEITGTRSTGNFPGADAMPAALTMLNLYDDDVEISGHTLIGVTHPDALDKYVFTLEGMRSVDDVLIYDIAVEPKYRQTSAFVGTVSVMDGVFALIEARLRPGPAFIFPFPIRRYEVTYLQQFSNYGGDIWLPVDLRSNAVVEISFGVLLSFPPIIVDQVSRFTDYQLNIALADSLFEEGWRLRIDSLAVASYEGFQREGVVVPLDPEETIAYASIDSTHSLREAYELQGPLGRALNRRAEMEERRESTDRVFGFFAKYGISPRVWYNRVDDFHGGLGYRKEFSREESDQTFAIEVGAGLSTGQKGAEQFSYDGAVSWEKDWFINVGYRSENTFTYQSGNKNRLTNSSLMLIGQEDYFDYYRRQGMSITGGYRLQAPRGTISATYQHENHSPLTGNTSYDLLGRSEPQRPNPTVMKGEMRTVTIEYTFGRPSVILIDPSKHLAISAEFSMPQSDFVFRRYYLRAGGRVNTFLRRRFIPATLDYGISVGMASEGGRTLPLQRSFIVEGGTTVYHWDGSLHTLRGLPYQGSGIVFGHWEHNFRTLPFELLGLSSMVDRGYNVSIFGGHAFIRGLGVSRHSWRRHNELGLSLSGIIGLARVDFAYHIEEKRFLYPTFGLARLF